MDQEKVGKFILKLRKEKELTQKELADVVGLTDKAVSKWETGKGLPDIEILKLLAEYFNVSLTDLLSGERVKNEKEDSKNDKKGERYITIGEAAALTANSINFYKQVEKTKAKKKFNWLLTIIILLIAFIIGSYFYNNYNKCKVYSIRSDYADIELSGILSITNDKNILSINNFSYGGNKITDVYAIEYSFMVDDKLLKKVGDISTFEFSNNVNKIDINQYFRSVNIYLDELSNKDINNILNSDDISIIFKYIGKDGIKFDYVVPIKLEKEYSNSKIM